VGDDGDIAHIITSGMSHESVLQWRARGYAETDSV